MIAINQIEEFTKELNFEQFVANKLCLYAVVYHIQIIGEATYKLTKEYRAKHSNMPWKMMEGMRHVLVHDYYNIKPQIVWGVVKKDIPSIKPLLQHLLNESQNQTEEPA